MNSRSVDVQTNSCVLRVFIRDGARLRLPLIASDDDQLKHIKTFLSYFLLTLLIISLIVSFVVSF